MSPTWTCDEFPNVAGRARLLVRRITARSFPGPRPTMVAGLRSPEVEGDDKAAVALMRTG